jgi:hypothetical protein
MRFDLAQTERRRISALARSGALERAANGAHDRERAGHQHAAYAESPFVFERNGMFWVSVSAYPLAWDATLVYRSTVPSAFQDAPYTRLRAHAAEWVFGRHGEVWLTHAGPGQRGVWMSRVDGM